MSHPSLAEDLEYLREMATAGAQAPLLGGRFLAWWGGVIATAYGCHYAILTDRIAGGPEAINIMWLIAIIAGLAGYVALLRLMPAKPGYGSAGNRVMGAVWSAGGFAIFAFFAGIALSHVLFGTSVSPNVSLPLVFAVYALGLMTSGTLGSDRLLILAGIAAFIFVALTVAFQPRPELYLIGAVGAALTVFLPGLALLRREPASVV